MEHRFHLLGISCDERLFTFLRIVTHFAHSFRTSPSPDGIGLSAILSVSQENGDWLQFYRARIFLGGLRISAPMVGFGLSLDDLGERLCQFPPTDPVV